MIYQTKINRMHFNMLLISVPNPDIVTSDHKCHIELVSSKQFPRQT